MSTQEQVFTIEELQAQLLSAADSGNSKKAEEIAGQLDSMESISSNNDENSLQLKLIEAYDSGNVAEANMLGEKLKELEPEIETLEETVVKQNFYVDQAKSGAADFVFSLLPDNFLGVDGLDKKYVGVDGLDFNEELYQQDLAKAQDEVKREFFDYKGIKPLSKTQRYLGSGVRATAAEGPLAFVGAKGPISLIGELLHTYTAATLGIIGGDAAADVAKSMGFGETIQNAFRNVASTVTGIATGVARVPVSAGMDAAGMAFKKRQEALSSVEKATERLANNDIEGIIKGASDSQPDLDMFIDKAVELQQTIPGLVIPPGAAMGENPIIVKNLDRLLKTNPAFYADINTKVKDGMKAVKKYRELNFGEGGQVRDKRILDAVLQDSGINLKNVNKKIDAIDVQIEKRINKIETGADYTSVGTSVKNLMKAKEQVVKQKLSPRYDQLLRKAELDGIEMPMSSVKNLYQAVKLQKLNDIFGIQPPLVKLVNDKFAPRQEVIDFNVLLAGGIKQKPETRLVYDPASVKDVDSLKRNLNSAIRKTSDPDSKRKLIEFKRQFQSELDLMPESFVGPYRDLDNQFYEELGIAKNSAGIKQLDAARFETKTGEYLANPEQARDFLAFTGSDGVPIVRDAVLIKMENAVMKDGTFDGAKFEGFMRNKKNKRLIDEVPGLRVEIETSGTAIKDMLEVKARLDADFNTKSTELTKGFVESVKKSNFNDVITSVINSPAVSARYMQDIKNFSPDTSKMLKQGIRSGLLERAMMSKDSVSGFISKNQNVFSQWFGPRYLENVNSIAEASDVLNRIKLNERFAVDLRNEDALKRATNISFAETSSLLRDRITNAGTKAAIAASKITSRQTEAKRDGYLMEMLSNPERLQSISNEIKAQKINSSRSIVDITMEQVNKVLNRMSFSVYKGAYFGEVGSDTYEEMQNDGDQNTEKATDVRGLFDNPLDKNVSTKYDPNSIKYM
jgi:hypothetical protein